MDELRDAWQFKAWVEIAEPGEVVEYHTGTLAIDRETDPSVDALADAAYQESLGSWRRMSACQHVRDVKFGLKRVHLSQEPLPGGGFRYFAERTNVGQPAYARPLRHDAIVPQAAFREPRELVRLRVENELLRARLAAMHGQRDRRVHDPRQGMLEL